MEFVFIALLILTYAVLAWRDLRLALVVLAGLLPTYLLRFSLGPFPTTALEGMVLSALLIFLIQERKSLKNIAHTTLRSPWGRAGLLLLAAASFGVAVAPDKIAALGIWKAYFVEPYLLFIAMRSLFQKTHWRSALQALACSGIVLSLVAVVQTTTGLGIPAPWDLERRATGLFPFPNALGLFIAPITSMSVVFFFDTWQKEKNKQALFWALSSVLGAVAILLAKTEAALIAVPAGLLAAFLFSQAEKRTKIRITLEATLICALLFLAVSPIREKLLLQDYSGQVRLAQWRETTQLLAAKPAFGAGLSGYPIAIEPYHDPTLYEIFQYPHNIFLNVWVELGLLGLVAFIWLGVLSVKTLWEASKKGQIPHIQLSAFAALVTMAVHGLVDVPYFKNDLAILSWIFFGVLALPFKHSSTKQHT